MDIFHDKKNISKEIQFGKNVKIGNNVVIQGTGTIADDVIIGHNVILEGDFIINENTRIDNFSLIRGNVEIGKNNWIYPYCSIGTGSQHKQFPENKSGLAKSRGKIIIGSDNIIREFCTVNMPAKKEFTKIGSDCYIMAYCHIAHDSIVHDHITMANQTTLGGAVEIFDFANIGLNVSIHPHCKIGSYSMIGMGNTITKNVLPYAIIINSIFSNINNIGLTRNNFSIEDIQKIYSIYKNNFLNNLDQNNDKFSVEISSFIKNSKRDSYLPNLKI